MQSKETLSFLNRTVDIVRRSRRRSLTLTMHPDRPLRVITNASTSHKEIFNFLLRKKTWIEKNLQQFADLDERFKEPPFEEGANFPFLGELKYLHFSITPRKQLFFNFEEGYLVCYLPFGKNPKDFFEREYQEQLTKLYHREAVRHLTPRVAELANITGLKPSKLSFRAQRTRWGSCSSRGHISLNWKIVCHSPSIIDYIIIHELCHLRHMNHSNDFWSAVENYYPSYKVAEKVLKSQERLGSFLKS